MKFSYFYWIVKLLISRFRQQQQNLMSYLLIRQRFYFKDQPNNEIHEICCSANIGETSK